MSEPSQNTRLLRALGLAVRERREQRRLSQAELAAATGVAEQHISALEHGQLNPGYELLLALADALCVGVGALVTRAEELAQDEALG